MAPPFPLPGSIQSQNAPNGAARMTHSLAPPTFRRQGRAVGPATGAAPGAAFFVSHASVERGGRRSAILWARSMGEAS